MTRAYEAILRVADALGLPRHYRTDLTDHDRRMLERRGDDCSFLWALYDCGTHVVILDDPRGPAFSDAGGGVASRWVETLEETFGKSRLRWYLWTGADPLPSHRGRELYELDSGRRAVRIAEDYEERAVARAAAGSAEVRS